MDRALQPFLCIQFSKIISWPARQPREHFTGPEKQVESFFLGAVDAMFA
jgi:hypothetical protein